MNVELMLIAKVYRKKKMQEITDRQTGRVTGEYYPVILDDGDNTVDVTVPREVYNSIEEDKIYLFKTRFNDSFRRENQSVKPRIEGVIATLPDWRKDFLKEFSALIYDSVNVPFDSVDKNVDSTKSAKPSKPVKTAAKSDSELPFN